jgi:spore coat protein CotH
MSSADPEYFRSGLESNRNDPAVDVTPMVRFAEALMAADDSTIESVLREYTDLDALMRYLAVDRAINHWDGPTAFRCQPAENVRPLPPEVFAAQTPPLGWEVCQNKNYFWYQEPDRDRMWLMAWDLDTSLSSFSQFPDWNTEPAVCEVQQQGRPPRCDRLINWFATVLRPHYVRAGQELLADLFQPDRLRAVAQPWYEQIAPLAGPGLFEAGAASLSAELDTRFAEFQQEMQH